VEVGGAPMGGTYWGHLLGVPRGKGRQDDLTNKINNITELGLHLGTASQNLSANSRRAASYRYLLGRSRLI
jgi:hypothetical protein